MNLLSKEFIRDVRRAVGVDYITSLLTSIFAPIVHDHDDRYFTETESDVRFAPVVHTHDDRYFTETESDARFAPIVHTHDDRYFTETESDARFAPVVHTHDDRYYTEAETNTLLNAKLNLARPAFMVTGGGTGDVAVDTVWVATTELYNYNAGSYSTVTGVYTVPTTGLYEFGGKFLNTNTKNILVTIQKNGVSQDFALSTSNAGFDMVPLYWIGQCTAGDTIRIVVSATYGMNTTGQYNKLWGKQIG